MKAETAFNVFEALTDVEKQRLLKMLPDKIPKKEKSFLKKPIITNAQAREIITARFVKFCKRRKKLDN